MIILKWLNRLLCYINRIYLKDRETCLLNIGYELYKKEYINEVSTTIGNIINDSLMKLFNK
jgi:hypothetical protein